MNLSLNLYIYIYTHTHTHTHTYIHLLCPLHGLHELFLPQYPSHHPLRSSLFASLRYLHACICCVMLVPHGHAFLDSCQLFFFWMLHYPFAHLFLSLAYLSYYNVRMCLLHCLWFKVLQALAFLLTPLDRTFCKHLASHYTH